MCVCVRLSTSINCINQSSIAGLHTPKCFPSLLVYQYFLMCTPSCQVYIQVNRANQSYKLINSGTNTVRFILHTKKIIKIAKPSCVTLLASLSMCVHCLPGLFLEEEKLYELLCK